MTKKEFDKYLARDGGCAHCGKIDETLVPQHRQSKQMGGSKLLDKSSNIIVFCSEANGLLESNANFAELGRKFGWKLRRGQASETTPVFIGNDWFLLDNDYKKIKIDLDYEYF